MKLKMILLALFAAGLFASIALAKQPPGKGNSSQTTTGATTTTTAAPGKVLVCHKVAHGKYVLLNVSSKSAHARLKNSRDVLAGPGGTCPGPLQGHTGTTTTTAATTTTTP